MKKVFRSECRELHAHTERKKESGPTYVGERYKDAVEKRSNYLHPDLDGNYLG